MMRILKTFIFTIFIFNLAFSGGTSVALLWIDKNNQNEVQDVSRHYVFPEVITHLLFITTMEPFRCHLNGAT